MGHDDVASGYPISTGFSKLMGCQRDPWDRGVTSKALIPKILRLRFSILKGEF